MQILVVVANVQARILKIEVEKGFALTAIGRKLVGPERNGNTICYVEGWGLVMCLSFAEGMLLVLYTPSHLERESGQNSGTRAVLFFMDIVVTHKQ